MYYIFIALTKNLLQLDNYLKLVLGIDRTK